MMHLLQSSNRVALSFCNRRLIEIYNVSLYFRKCYVFCFCKKSFICYLDEPSLRVMNQSAFFQVGLAPGDSIFYDPVAAFSCLL